jgi:hypothetical protein
LREFAAVYRAFLKEIHQTTDGPEILHRLQLGGQHFVLGPGDSQIAIIQQGLTSFAAFARARDYKAAPLNQALNEALESVLVRQAEEQAIRDSNRHETRAAGVFQLTPQHSFDLGDFVDRHQEMTVSADGTRYYRERSIPDQPGVHLDAFDMRTHQSLGTLTLPLTGHSLALEYYQAAQMPAQAFVLGFSGRPVLEGVDTRTGKTRPLYRLSPEEFAKIANRPPNEKQWQIIASPDGTKAALLVPALDRLVVLEPGSEHPPIEIEQVKDLEMATLTFSADAHEIAGVADETLKIWRLDRPTQPPQHFDLTPFLGPNTAHLIAHARPELAIRPDAFVMAQTAASFNGPAAASLLTVDRATAKETHRITLPYFPQAMHASARRQALLRRPGVDLRHHDIRFAFGTVKIRGG